MSQTDLTDTDRHAPEQKTETPVSGYYKSGREHLTDELLKLDTLIYLQVLKFQGLHSTNRSDRLNGLYITEEEINRILTVEPGTQNRPGPRAEKSQIEGLLNHAERLQSKISKRIENSLKLGAYLPLTQLSYLFGFTPFEQDIVLIFLAPELDPKYERLYAYLQDDVTKKHPSVNLVLDILSSTSEQRSNGRISFDCQAPLLKYNLIRFCDNSQPKHFLSRPLEIDDRIVNFLLELNSLDSRISSFVKLLNPEKDWSAVVMDGRRKERLIQLSGKKRRKGGQQTQILER